jgi:hypothetical protein
MRNPYSIIPSVPASTIQWTGQTIPLIRARTLSITCRLDFGQGVDANPEIFLFFSPDGNNWDTQAYTSFTITFTASSTRQRTAIIDVPEHGYIWVKIQNLSANGALSNCKFWYTIQSWDAIGSNLNEEIMKKEALRETIEATGQLEL